MSDFIIKCKLHNMNKKYIPRCPQNLCLSCFQYLSIYWIHDIFFNFYTGTCAIFMNFIEL